MGRPRHWTARPARRDEAPKREDTVDVSLRERATNFAEELRRALGKKGLVVEQLSPVRIRVVYPKSLKVHAALVIDGAVIRNGITLSKFE